MNQVSQQIFGYSDGFSVSPGESLSFKVSCEGVARYDASLVKLRHGFTGESGPGFLETPVESSFEGSYEGIQHVCQPGSYVEITDKQGLLRSPNGLVIEAHVYPTLPQGTRSGNFGAYHVTQNSFESDSSLQAILGNWSVASCSGYALVLEEGRPTFIWVADGETKKVSLATPLIAHQWYRVIVSVKSDAGTVCLEQTPIDNIMNRLSASASALRAESRTVPFGARLTESQAPFRFGTRLTESQPPFRIGALAFQQDGRWLANAAYNGKIGGVRILRPSLGDAAVSELAAWHFGKSLRDDGLLLSDVVDVSGNGLHGRCFNAPTRGVAGHRFKGLSDDFRRAPDEFDAIHFHDDDITDAQWPTAFKIQVPDDLASGVYAAKLSSAGVEQYIPFFVRPGRQKREVAVLFSTATYLAYANDRIAFEANGAEIIVSRTPIIDRQDLTLQDHPEFGRSCYEIHNDGSGVVFGSTRRPILTLNPKHRAWFQAEGVWGLPADLCIVHWLDTIGCEFDALTDEDLDREGVDLLKDYKVLITGSHPEYVTRNELNAIEAFTGNGGRLMYLGGNGFFATVSFDPEERHVMELRRSDAGTRPHESPFGDRRHQTSGEMAGLWRNKGKAPQRLLGVGFAAQGFDRCTYYERLTDSYDPLAAFAFEGIGSDERIGDFGIMGGGAAGAEIDRYDPSLGAPPGALVLATSGPLSDAYLLAAEDVYESIPGIGGTEQSRVRADIVLCPLPGGGGVFSVGSIAYTGSLSHNRYDNNVARLTGNVLKRFLHPEALDVIIDCN